MKVKDLINVLKNLNPEADIFMATDEEGNSYHQLDDVEQINSTQAVFTAGVENYDFGVNQEGDIIEKLFIQ